MSEKCPFCGEPSTRETLHGYTYRCGTRGPDINDEYVTGRTCDRTVWVRLLAEKDAEIEQLRAENARLLALMDRVVAWREERSVR